jgi:hypothetical protein
LFDFVEAIIMDGKEIDLAFLSCSVPLDGKELDFCLIVQLFVSFLFHSQEDGLQKHELMNN